VVLDKDAFSRSPSRMVLYTLLFGILFHYVQLLIRISSKFIKVWHAYYSVRVVESVTQYGSVEVLSWISGFDNFVSSPGLPITGAILSLVTDLKSEYIIAYFGLPALIICILSSYLILRKLFNNITGLVSIYATLISISIINFLYALFNYSLVNVSLLTLMVFILLTLSEDKSRAAVVISDLLVVSSVIYYMPGTLLLVSLIFIFMLLARTFYARRLGSGGLFSVILFSAAFSFAYFVYVGSTFYNDFHEYLLMFLRSLKAEPFVVYAESRIQMLDPVMKILVYTSRLGVSRIFTFLAGSLSCIIYFRKKHFWFVTTGIALTLLSGLSIFIHEITDYTLRFNIYLYIFAPAFTAGFLSMLRKTVGLKRFNHLQRSKAIKGLQTLILTFILFIPLFGGTSSWLFSQVLMPTNPKTASDIYYFMDETYDLSKFIGTYVSSNITIIGNYRYGYVKAIYDLDFIEMNDYFINSIERYRSLGWILILSTLSKKAPDRYCSVISNDKYELLDWYINKIYDSSLSIVYENIGD